MVDKNYYVKAPDPETQEMILAKAIDFEVIKEDWNEYKLADGTVVKVKTVVQSISYLIDPETQEIKKNPTGEPTINVRYNVIITALFPENKLK